MDHQPLCESDLNEGLANRICCCDCGVLIEPNPSNMCVACLRSHIDITAHIPKQVTLQFCRGCERYLQPPSDWVKCSLESRELLGLCLKRLKTGAVKLVDASFVWTEPHSRRIKVKVTVHGEVSGGTILQQIFVVEYIVAHQMCDSCHRSEAQDFWRAIVQIRHKGDNHKSFFYLEQLILKHKAHLNTLGIKPLGGNRAGLDFYYATESHARKMVDFVCSMLPCKYQHSKKLLSHDIHSNIYNYKFTYVIDIVPIGKDSVVCLPKKVAQLLGGISPICVIYRIASAVHLIDPSRAQIAEVSSTMYWRYPFTSICNPSQLTEYIVMDVELVKLKDQKSFPGQGAISHKHRLADAWLVKSSDLGITDNTIHTRTHLGHFLKAGDRVLCYNLQDSNINNEDFDKLDRNSIPDVLIVKKYYDRASRKRRRVWKLQHMAEENNEMLGMNTDEEDYNDFLDDLEEDPVLRQNVNIFKDPKKLAQIPVDEDDDCDEDTPHITLAEMLNDLVMDDAEMQ